MEFLTDWGVVIALVCAGCAVLYGVVTSRWLLALSPGNEEMQEHLRGRAGGREGLPDAASTRSSPASPWCSRSCSRSRSDVDAPAIGFADRRHLLRRRRLHRHERVGAGQRPRGGVAPAAAFARRSTWPSRAARSPACSWPGSRCSAWPATTASCILAGISEQGRDRRARRPRLRRLADLGLRPTRRRHLHQGRRRGRRPRRQDRGGHPRGRPAQPGRDRRQRGRQRRRLRRHGGRPVRDLRGHRGRRDAARRPHLPGDRRRSRSTRS